MKTSELKDKSVEELQTALVALTKDQFNFRMQKSTGQLGQTHLLKTTKKDIARVKTQIRTLSNEKSTSNEKSRVSE